ncbi:MAG: DUF366 family protein [Deltaproteobacteria bacterium]|nr:DUF366 family protein [Deltaproteobacteria bacterium]
MKQIFLTDVICYDGTQLRSHWIFNQTGMTGDAISAFTGPADVSTDHMVDLVDVKNNAPIFSTSMLHFLIEHFDTDLEKMILRQRLLITITLEELHRHNSGKNVARKGNDLFDGDRKLSVCIAAPTPVSCCIHFGINILSEGTPVPTKGLTDFGIDPKGFSVNIMQRYAREMEEVQHSRCKVRAVR